MNIKSYIFVSVVNQWNEDVKSVQDFIVYSQGWKTSNEASCEWSGVVSVCGVFADD